MPQGLPAWLWDYRHMSLYLAFAQALRIELKSSGLHSRQLETEPSPQSLEPVLTPAFYV